MVSYSNNQQLKLVSKSRIEEDGFTLSGLRKIPSGKSEFQKSVELELSSYKYVLPKPFKKASEYTNRFRGFHNHESN